MMLDIKYIELRMSRFNEIDGVDNDGNVYYLHKGYVSLHGAISVIIDVIKTHKPDKIKVMFNIYVSNDDKDMKKQINTYYKRLQKIEDATGISFEYPSIKNIKGFDIKGSYVSVGNIKKQGE